MCIAKMKPQSKLLESKEYNSGVFSIKLKMRKEMCFIRDFKAKYIYTKYPDTDLDLRIYMQIIYKEMALGEPLNWQGKQKKKE